MIGQNIGLEHLLPMALDILSANPMAEGDYYPGDLLSSVVSARREYFLSHPDATRRVLAILASAERLIRTIPKHDTTSVDTQLLERINALRMAIAG